MSYSRFVALIIYIYIFARVFKKLNIDFESFFIDNFWLSGQKELVANPNFFVCLNKKRAYNDSLSKLAK